MKFYPKLCLVAAIVLVWHATVCAEKARENQKVIAFPETGLALPQPNGFEKADSFYGFQQPSSGASVMVSVIPGPFSEVTKGFDKTNLATKGMELLSKKPVKINNESGILLQIALHAGDRRFLKWIVIFGDENRTNMVAANIPASHAEKLSETLLEVILATVAVNDRGKASPLPFNIDTAEGLMPVKKIIALGKMAMFTRDGTIPQASPEDPMFMVGPSLGDVPVGDRKQFATKRLHLLAHTKIESIISTSKVRIDGLSGIEIIATGLDQDSKTNLTVYQVMLFPQNGGYVLMVGLVGKANGKEYMPKFVRMAKTYKMSQP